MAEAETARLRRRLAALEAETEVLRAARQRDRAIIESAVDFAIIATDRDGRVTEWNKGAARILGWTAKDMQGEPVDRIFTPEDRANHRPLTETSKTLSDGRASDERWHLRRDGARFRASGEMLPLHGEDGAHLGFLKIIRDITESLHARERLDLSEASLRLANEAAEIGTWDLDLKTDILTWSDRTKAMFGISPNAPCSMDDFYAGLHPDDRDATSQAFASALDPARRASYDVEYRTIGKEDNAIRWIAAKGRGVFDAEGSCVRAIGTAIDITARKAAARRLLKSEAELRALNVDFERQVIERSHERGLTWRVSPDLLGVANQDGYFERSNPAWNQVLGWSETELAETPFFDFIHPDDIERTKAAFHNLKNNEPVLRFENRYRRKNGGYRWLSWVAVPEEGKIYSSARDITAEKEQAAELAARTAERDLLWRNSQDLLVIIDTKGTFRAVSPAVVKILGRAPEEMIGRLVFDFIHPDDLPSTDGALALATKEELPIYENRYLHKDGSYRWISWVAAPEGELIYATGRHITAEKQQAEALKRSEARLRTIFQTSYQLQGLLALDGAVLDVNDTALQVIKAKLEDVVGKPFWETPWFTNTKDMPELVRRTISAVANGETMHQEISVNVAIGLRIFDFMIRPVRDEHGTVIAMAPGAIDITERRQAEEQLRQSQKMEAVGQLTGGIAHDFNNLLTGISGSLELLQARVAQGRIKDLDRYVAAASGAASRAAALTHRLLAFSRRQTLDPKPTNINRLAADMEELIQRTVGPAIAIEMVLACGLWPTLCDPNQLENALLNLCINARDAMPHGGRLTVETCNRWLDDRASRERDLPPGQYVSLCVSDNGSGMTPEVTARAFDPFFTTKPLGMGTGLGLSMIYGFARQSGGQVRIYSEIDQGTMVCLYLPRYRGAMDAEESRPELATAPRAEQGQTVLIVDDEPTVRLLVAEVLEDLGYTAIEAADGAGALGVLQSNARIDLLVTDVGLPGGMNGRQLADAARQARPRLRVLFITGYAENAVIGHGHLDPGMHVLTKPFAMEALASRIKDLISGL